jgi:hypothetical protein
VTNYNIIAGSLMVPSPALWKEEEKVRRCICIVGVDAVQETRRRFPKEMSIEEQPRLIG